MMAGIKDKVVLVTGASSGIGLCVAHALARSGARVAFASRSLGKLEIEAGRARNVGGAAMAVRLDVSDAASALEAVAEVVKRWDRLDVVVNNAGNAGEMGWWADMAPDAARELFAVHMFGAEQMLRAVLPVMRRQGGGVVVNFCSTVGFVPMPGAASYSAAKAAVIAFTEAVRAELAPEKIDVRLFSPPHTRTESGKRMPLDLLKIFEPGWVAESFVAFLRSGKARAIPGGNSVLLWVQRLWPALAARIMQRIGFQAMRRVLAERSLETARQRDLEVQAAAPGDAETRASGDPPRDAGAADPGR